VRVGGQEVLTMIPAVLPMAAPIPDMLMFTFGLSPAVIVATFALVFLGLAVLLHAGRRAEETDARTPRVVRAQLTVMPDSRRMQSKPRRSMAA
jgi:hypothetical protein